MKALQTALLILAGAGTLAPLRAQYTSPAAAPTSPGELDAWLTANVPGFTGWDIGVDERFRLEDRRGAGTTNAGSNFDFSASPTARTDNHYWISRLMPRVGWSGGWISAMVELRSSYSWGDERYSPTAPGKALVDDDGPLQIEQAYVALGDAKKGPVSVKVGRQELAFGEQRLIGSAMWLNVPHTFDAVRATWMQPGWTVDAFTGGLVYTRRDHFDESDPHDRLSGFNVDTTALVPNVTFDAYLFARNVSREVVGDDWAFTPAPFRFPGPQDLYTLGVRGKSKPGSLGPWDWSFEGMWQLGNRTAVYPGTTVAVAEKAPRLTQDAWAFVAQTGYSFKGLPWKQRVALIVSAASGNQGDAGKSQTFQNLLPSNHDLYGVMDLSGLQNLVDYRLSWSMKPTTTTSIAIDAHQQYLETTSDFWYNAASAPRNTPGATPGSGRGFNINPGYSSDLGQELDLIAGWKVCKGLTVEIGAGHFFRGDYIKESFAAVGSHDANYGFFQTTAHF
ncbi:MAG TPA: alginate export family protein [Opitutaceae bacterium]|jgi:hypothetical protein